ncbi:MAG TPA: hypothetical protein VLK29_04320 [Luteimonas sp.]|nr:hypothetical protein [Luteimonas sp.]
MSTPAVARGPALAVILGVASAACAQGSKMDSTDAHAPLTQAAVAAGWAADDIELLPDTRLDRGGCTFHAALHRKTLDAPSLALATLPDGSVVAAGDSAGAVRVLDRCGADAPPEWWAEVVSRFAEGAAGKVVRPSNAADIEAIEQRGGRYRAPDLGRDGDATVLTFHVIQSEPKRPAAVTATLSGGRLTVTREPIGD